MPVIIRTKTNWIILSKEILATGRADGNTKDNSTREKSCRIQLSGKVE